MTDKEQIIHSYMKEIKRCLPICREREKKYMNDLQNALMDFSNETQGFTYHELLERFGSPKDLAANYLLETDAQRLSREIRYSHRIKLMSACAAGIVITSLAIIIMLQYFFYYNARTSYISREVTIIEEDDNN